MNMRASPTPSGVEPIDNFIIETDDSGNASVGNAARQDVLPSEWQQLIKRIFDICAASAGLFMLAPLLLMIALGIALDSRGPVLFRQRRAGLDGRVFRIFKFRTMTTLDDGAFIRQASRGDQRVTRVGAFLRKTSLDELPQLLNVIKGDMSLVGPRPHALAHDAHYGPLITNYYQRQLSKPGLTGWAQVNGYRGETINVEAMAQRVKHDLWYVSNQSFLLDIRVILMTILQLVHLKNVY